MKVTEKQIAKELVKCYGIVSQVARNLGVNRWTIADHIKRSETLQGVCKQCRESFIDEGESALVTAVKNNEGWAISLLLKTLGKDRGYIEKKEIDVNSRNELSISLSEEEIKKISKIARSVARKITSAGGLEKINKV